MARLKARGRTEVLKVEGNFKYPPTDNKYGVAERRITQALMSDGHILKKVVSTAQDGHRINGDWKDAGKVKPGLTPQQVEEIWVKAGYKVVSRGAGFEAGAVRTEKKAAAEKAAQAKRAKKRQEELAKEVGFYVRHRGTSHMKPFIAAGPFEELPEAIEAAKEKLAEFRTGRFLYLLPVQVVKTSTKHDAEWMMAGEPYWENGQRVYPGQTALKL